VRPQRRGRALRWRASWKRDADYGPGRVVVLEGDRPIGHVDGPIEDPQTEALGVSERGLFREVDRADQRDWYPVDALREADVPIGIGLDDPGWFGTWDLFREASRARLLANYEYGAHQYHSRDLLRMLTIDGARTLGLDDQIGSLESGKRADVILLDVDSAAHQPLYNLPAAIVNTVTAGDVETVIVDGDPLLHDGTVMSMNGDTVLAAARRAFNEFLERTGWDATFGAVHPPNSGLWRRVSPAVLVRYTRQALRGIGPTIRTKL
jgi:hypothetical protein